MSQVSIQPHNSPRNVAARWTTAGAALLIATAGYVHLCLYRRGYRFIPSVGDAFILQAAASFLVAAVLIGGALRRAPRRNTGWTARLWSRLGALGLLAASLTAFTISRMPSGLFGFYERGFDPAPKAAVAFFSEVAAVVLVAASLAAERAAHTSAATRRM